MGEDAPQALRSTSVYAEISCFGHWLNQGALFQHHSGRLSILEGVWSDRNCVALSKQKSKWAPV